MPIFTNILEKASILFYVYEYNSNDNIIIIRNHTKC